MPRTVASRWAAATPTQALIFFGVSVVLTQLGGPDGGRAGFATVAVICLIRFVVEQVHQVRQHRRTSGKER